MIGAGRRVSFSASDYSFSRVWHGSADAVVCPLQGSTASQGFLLPPLLVDSRQTAGRL
jgi:hypothetical protein